MKAHSLVEYLFNLFTDYSIDYPITGVMGGFALHHDYSQSLSCSAEMLK